MGLVKLPYPCICHLFYDLENVNLLSKVPQAMRQVGSTYEVQRNGSLIAVAMSVSKDHDEWERTTSVACAKAYNAQLLATYNPPHV